MATRRAIALDLDRFRYTYDENRATTKANGKPIIRSNDYGVGSFETGYDTVNVSGEPEKCHMVCTVCLGLPRYPIELRHCGHVFCFVCITRTLNYGSPITNSPGAPCPCCKHTFLMSSIVEFKRSSRALQNIYNTFDVRCVYGCGRVCSPRAMLEHETWECTQRPVGCINDGCGVLLTDAQMEQHLVVCPRRFVYCNSCMLPRRLNGTGHNCLRTMRETLKGMQSFFPPYVSN